MIEVRRLVALAALCFVAALTSQTDAAPGAPSGQPFPEADAESVGLSRKGLELLAARAQRLVDDGEIVGGELMVIKNRRTVFREAYGFKDREAEVPLPVDSIYCVRSMTKPLVGTAIQMLVDEGKLELDTLVHEILPFFKTPQMRKITVEHLLTHTAGFPFTTIAKPLSEYADLAEVAAEAAGKELLFEPGARYEYSDAGSDTLGAIVARITGAPVEQFIQQRILDPLSMRDTVVLLEEGDEALARVPSAYSGGTGSWDKHWEPSDPPIFPVFLASQSLYSTTTDYARFLAMWMDAGRVGDRRLLSEQAVERGLSPNRAMNNYPAGFEGLDPYYGQQMMVYAESTGEGPPKRIVFGHGGSDGTHAWAWPELDLMVLFFTQSRGTLAGIALERVLQTVLVDQALDDPSLATHRASPEAMEQVAGLYWDENVAHAYYIVTPRENRLTVERPGRMHLVFKADESADRYVHELDPRIWVEFVRGEDDTVRAMRTHFGRRVELDPRHVADEGLPSAEEVIALVKQAHRVDRLSELGVVRLSGTLEIEARQAEGSLTTLFDATRGRTEIQVGGAEQLIVINGGRVWSHSSVTGTDELEGQLLEQALLDRFSVRFGDWSEHYEHVEVLKRVRLGDDAVLLVRVVPRAGPGATMFVHEASGRVGATASLVQLPGVGIVGVQTQYDDFRDVGGMRLPFTSVARYTSELIGRVITRMDASETGVEASEETFAVSE